MQFEDMDAMAEIPILDDDATAQVWQHSRVVRCRRSHPGGVRALAHGCQLAALRCGFFGHSIGHNVLPLCSSRLAFK